MLITTVARFKPELVTVPADIPNGPKAGTKVLAEPVPTAVAVGPDGAYYVSEMTGFPPGWLAFEASTTDAGPVPTVVGVVVSTSSTAVPPASSDENCWSWRRPSRGC